MRFNRPQALINFKSYLNCLLIDFFDPSLKPDFNSLQRNRLNHVGFKLKKSIYIGDSLNLIKNSSNLIKNSSNLIKNDINPVVFDHFLLKLTFSFN